MFNDVVISYIRTIIPMVVGFLVAWLQPLGIDIDGSAAIALLTTIVSGLYYIVVRFLEKHFPKLGWLLGMPAAPKYHED